MSWAEFINNPIVIITGTLAVVGVIWRFGVWMGAVNEHMSQVVKFMEEIRDDIKQIFRKLPNTPVSSQSPLQLTELGKSISEKLRGKEWAKNTAPKLMDKIRGKPAYEIQEFCFSYVARQDFHDEQNLLCLIRE